MTKNQPISNQVKEQIKQTILQTIKKEKPENAQQLIKLVQEKTALSSEEITQLLIQLENEDRLHFTKKETLLPPTPQTYVLSKKAAWYWVIIAIAILTTLTVFIIPDNAYPIVYLRSALGIVFVLFLPGYTFIKMLFPSKVPIKTSSENMDTIERLALSLGMSNSSRTYSRLNTKLYTMGNKTNPNNPQPTNVDSGLCNGGNTARVPNKGNRSQI